MIAGLLWYRHNGRKALLCAALFVAPLLQYGLVVFSVAVLAAAVLLPPRARPAKTGRLRRELVADWLRRRSGLALPAAFFLAGCALTYLTILRYQLEIAGPGFAYSIYYQKLYFGGDYQVLPVLEFAIASVWNIARHHLPLLVILAVLGAVAVGLLATGAGRLYRIRQRAPQPGHSKSERKTAAGHWDVIALLFLPTLTVAVVAGLFGQYPATPTRHITYLGPAVFLGSGGALAAAIHGLVGAIRWLAGAIRRRRRMPARTPGCEPLTLALTLAVAALLAGASSGGNLAVRRVPDCPSRRLFRHPGAIGASG